MITATGKLEWHWPFTKIRQANYNSPKRKDWPSIFSKLSTLLHIWETLEHLIHQKTPIEAEFGVGTGIEEQHTNQITY